MTEQSSYEKVKEFHDVFHPAKNMEPTAFTPEEALHRASFTTEEMIEFICECRRKQDRLRSINKSVER